MYSMCQVKIAVAVQKRLFVLCMVLILLKMPTGMGADIAKLGVGETVRLVADAGKSVGTCNLTL